MGGIQSEFASIYCSSEKFKLKVNLLLLIVQVKNQWCFILHAPANFSDHSLCLSLFHFTK